MKIPSPTMRLVGGSNSVVLLGMLLHLDVGFLLSLFYERAGEEENWFGFTEKSLEGRLFGQISRSITFGLLLSLSSLLVINAKP